MASNASCKSKQQECVNIPTERKMRFFISVGFSFTSWFLASLSADKIFDTTSLNEDRICSSDSPNEQILDKHKISPNDSCDNGSKEELANSR
ncbi:Uncharacterised protein [Chlamydia trachomatis]|nr:Uncharacterised protein [Chlamydia trachomatis]